MRLAIVACIVLGALPHPLIWLADGHQGRSRSERLPSAPDMVAGQFAVDVARTHVPAAGARGADDDVQSS